MKQNPIIAGVLLTLLMACTENKPTKQSAATDNPDSLTGKSTYVNPVDNKTYTTSGQFEEYAPEGGVQKVDGPVQMLKIVLLTDQQQLPDIINIEKLANFIKGADTVVFRQFTGVKDSGQVLVQFTLHANKKPTIGISYSGTIQAKDLKAVSNKIEQYSSNTRTQKDSCIFQCLYGINETKQ
jgi:hypothetical protein